MKAESKLYAELRTRPSWVLSIIGSGGSGKTSKAYWMVDNWFPNDKIFIFRYPEKVLDQFPSRMRNRIVIFNELKEIAGKPGIILLDDVAISFLSRSSASGENKDLLSTMTIGRHNDHRYIVTVQNSILTDKGVYESLDQFSIRCKMTEIQTMTERTEFVLLQKDVNKMLDELTAGLSYNDSKGFCYCSETDEILIFPDWEFMNEEISKPFKGGYVSGSKLSFI